MFFDIGSKYEGFMVDTRSVDDMTKVSHNIPDEVKIAIADALIAFNRMDAASEALIWALTGLSFQDGKLLIGMDTRPKLAILKKLIEQKFNNEKRKFHLRHFGKSSKNFEFTEMR